jgi:hypothetical protein
MFKMLEKLHLMIPHLMIPRITSASKLLQNEHEPAGRLETDLFPLEAELDALLRPKEELLPSRDTHDAIRM